MGGLDLSRELLQSAGLQGDGEVEFGDRGPGFASLGAMRNEAAALTGAPTVGAPGPAPGPGVAAPQPAAGAVPGSEQDTEARLQALMNQPSREGENACPPRGEQAPAGQQEIPREMKFGPLTRTQRARYSLHQMGKGLSIWFNCNKAWLIPAIILVVIGLIAAEILTEGAITAALPAIMQVLTAVMLGIAAARSALYLGEYVTKAASGDIAGGARSLARSVAVIAVEAAFALLFNSGAVMKALKGGVVNAVREGFQAARAFGRATVEATEQLGRIALRGAEVGMQNLVRIPGAILREGRLIMEGVGEGVGRGMRSLEDLARRLWNRVRFRRFKLRRSGRNLQLWGEINPWVLLANGDITWMEYENVRRSRGMGERIVGTMNGRLVEGWMVRGSRARPNYRHIAEVFIEEARQNSNVIHHSIEQQVRRRWPHLFTVEQINAGSNLRVILAGAFNSESHLSKIRVLWDAFYAEFEIAMRGPGFTDDMARNAILSFRDSVDDYLRQMQSFMANDARIAAASAAGNEELVRQLLAGRSQAILNQGEFAQAALDRAFP